MPELPEVETTAKSLNRLLPGRKVLDVWSSYGGVIHRGKNHIKNKSYFKEFKKEIIGEKIKKVSRRGKNVLIELSSGKTILIHMKMTGHLLYGKYCRAGNSKLETLNSKQAQNSKFKTQNVWKNEKWIPAEKSQSPLWDPFNRFIRLVFTLSGEKHLVLSDMRKFAKVCLLKEGEKNELEDLGPEPLEKNFNFSLFKERVFKKPRGRIKQVLMDQKIIAGVGNIYADESLFLSGIHPGERVEDISQEQLKKIFVNMKKVLKKGLNFGGDSTSDYRTPDGKKGAFQLHHLAYQRTGERCREKVCRGVILRKVVGGRSAHFCSEHQKLSGRLLGPKSKLAKNSKK